MLQCLHIKQGDIVKYCKKCDKKKNEKEFGKDCQKKNGLSSSCKECIRKRSKKQRENNLESVKKYAIEYRKKNKELLRKKAWLSYYIDWDKRSKQAKKSYEKHRQKIALKRAAKRRLEEEKEKNRIRQQLWRQENRSTIGKAVAEWKKRNPQKAAAHTLVLWAIKSGILVKPLKCEECKKLGKIEGHHEDYLKPLEVKWLCKSCHCKKHQIYR